MIHTLVRAIHQHPFIQISMEHACMHDEKDLPILYNLLYSWWWWWCEVRLKEEIHIHLLLSVDPLISDDKTTYD
jgi:hypothetical protein